MKNVKKQTKKITTKAINMWSVSTLIAEASAVFVMINTNASGEVKYAITACGVVICVNVLQKLYTLCSK